VLQIGTPHDIYESPADDFVARFIGETNLYNAEVVSVVKLDKSQTEYMAELRVPELGRVMCTTVDEIQIGQKVIFTIRPEKILISKEKPATKREDINLFHGLVEEPIYSGFQTKFYVKLNEEATLRIIKQHAKYSDEGPDIVWKDEVYISWSAIDGYIVGVKEA
jgi:spermidine/putrescine transport system ATP-binding protein